MESLLNVYDNKKFYCSSRQLLTILSQFTRLLPEFLRQKKRVIAESARRKAAGMPSFRRYDAEHDARIQSILRQLATNKDSLSISEKVFGAWVLTKGER